MRKKSGLSQEQLASELNVSRQASSKWETDSSDPESEKLIALSKYFQASVDYLIKDEERKENPGQEQPNTAQETISTPNKKIRI